jgi:molybdopterin synthase sulfur carrier subunit
MSKIKLLYFAWVRQKTGLAEEIIDLPAELRTVSDLIAWLKQRGPGYAAAFEDERFVRAAVDQQHAAPDTDITGAREIAFFPPVTGG